MLMIPLGFFFLGLLPTALVRLSALLDRALHLPRLRVEPVNRLVGSLLMVAGWLLAMWTIVVQFTSGRGTPLPAVAPQELIVSGPYRVCRNPMVLGTVIMYLGLAVNLGSLAAVALVIVPAIWLLAYVKRWEEPALEARFGEAYRMYREHTPFLLPRLGGRPA
jgi:protein-S-isoprenylcysteine O-methyltransferase Ste14